MLRPEPEPRAIGMLFSFLLNISESCFTLLRLCRPSFSALYLQVIIWFLHFFHVILLIALRDWPPVSKCHFQILGIRHSLASFEPDVPPSITLVPTWMPGTHIWRMGAIPWERENCNLGTHFKKIPIIYLSYLKMVIPAQAPNHPSPYKSYTGSLENDVQFGAFRKVSRWF